MALDCYIEDAEAIPAYIFQDTADPAPGGFTLSNTVANFINYGWAYGVERPDVVDNAVTLVGDWATGNAADKAMILSYIENNEFLAAIPTVVRDDLTPPYLGFEIFNTTTSTRQEWNGAAWV